MILRGGFFTTVYDKWGTLKHSCNRKIKMSEMINIPSVPVWHHCSSGSGLACLPLTDGGSIPFWSYHMSKPVLPSHSTYWKISLKIVNYL